jgi:tripartite motif-containing protein 71
VKKFTKNGTFIIEWGLPGEGAGEFLHPYGVAIDSNNDVYVADTEISDIQKFNKDGQFIRKLGSEGSGQGQFGWMENIDLDSKNNLYVADTANKRIQVFSPFLMDQASGEMANKIYPTLR